MDLAITGHLISDAQKEKVLTQKELGAELGATDKAVSKSDRGLSFPDVSLLKPIMSILGITLTDLIYEEENKRKI